MTRRRRCLLCKELFTADPRVGARQKVCGREECQRERHRQNCADWWERERGPEEEYRLRKRLGSPQEELRLDVVRDECGAKIKVVIQEVVRLVVAAPRDECRTKRLEQRGESFCLVPLAPRDERDAPRPPP